MMEYAILIWACLIVLFTVVEALTLGLTSIWFAVGALGGLIASALGFGLVVQLVVFLIVGFLLSFYTRPIAKKVFKVGQNKTNIDALIGQIGFVTMTIEEKNLGQVKLNGQIWSAKSQGHDTINVGEEVEVLAIEGVKIIVKRAEEK